MSNSVEEIYRQIRLLEEKSRHLSEEISYLLEDIKHLQDLIEKKEKA